MGRTIKAMYSKGVIKPLEKFKMSEGKEVTVTIIELPVSAKKVNGLKASAGGWKDSIDCEKLKRDIYADRLISTRPVVKL